MQAGQPCAADDASFPDTAKLQSSGTAAQRVQVGPSPEPLQEGKPVVAGHSTTGRSSNQRRSQHARQQRGDSRQTAPVGQLAVSHGKAPSGSVLQSSEARIAGSKPRILEVRRPRRPAGVKQLSQQDSAKLAAHKAGTAETRPARQQLHVPS